MNIYKVLAVHRPAPWRMFPQVDQEPAYDLDFATALAKAWMLKKLLRVDQHGRVEPGEFFYSEVRIVDEHGEDVTW